jgi:hypothetical protein
MLRTHLISLLACTLLIAELCAPARASDQALMVIANANAGVRTISRDELEAIFALSRRSWPNGTRIVVLNLESGTPERTHFDHAVLGMPPDRVARFWIDRRTRGGGDAPRRVPSAALMMRVIPALAGSIGYAPEAPLTPGMKRIARIVNGSVVPEP